MKKVTLIFGLYIVVVALIMLIFFLTVPHAHAKGGDGDTTLCASPLISRSSVSDTQKKTVSQSLTVVSECHVLKLDQMEALSAALKASIAQWRESLSNSPSLAANILYGYELKVLNDRDTEIDFNLGGWEFTHSPYPLMWGGFSYKIPACSKLSVGFISPNTPVNEDVSINVMSLYKGKLVTEGDGRSSIIIPAWPGLHHPGTLTFRPLAPEERESIGCKRN